MTFPVPAAPGTLEFFWLFIPCISSLPVKRLLFFALVVKKIEGTNILILSCISCYLYPVYPVKSFVFHILTPEPLLLINEIDQDIQSWLMLDWR
jgi:hypothetical protein